MPFVLSDKFVGKLLTLKEDYQKKAGVNLVNQSQPYAIFCFFGAKDVDKRKEQIFFLETWIKLLRKDLVVDGVPLHALPNHLTALRLLVVASLYVRAQIEETYKFKHYKASPTLVQLLHDALGIIKNNDLDQQTLLACFTDVKACLTSEEDGRTVKASLYKEFPKEQWQKFLEFVMTELAILSQQKPKNDVVKKIIPWVAKPLELAGYSTGYLLGDMIGKSVPMLPAKYALMATIGSGLMLIIKPAPALGVMLLVPTYAGKIIDNFCGVSLAWILGAAGKIAGYGLGFGVGVSVDLTWKLLCKTCSILARLYEGNTPGEIINGISLVSGRPVYDGVELEIIDEEFLSKNCAQYKSVPVLFNSDNKSLKVSINGEEADFLWDKDNHFYYEELKKLFESQASIHPSKDTLSMESQASISSSNDDSSMNLASAI